MVLTGSSGVEAVQAWMGLQSFRVDRRKVTAAIVTRSGRARLRAAILDALRGVLRRTVVRATLSTLRGVAARPAAAQRLAERPRRPSPRRGVSR